MILYRLSADQQPYPKGHPSLFQLFMIPWMPCVEPSGSLQLIRLVAIGKWKENHLTVRRQHLSLPSAHVNFVQCHLGFVIPLVPSSV